MMIRAMVWLAAILSLPGTARAAELLAPEHDGLSFERFIEKTLSDYEVPGAVVAVVKADGGNLRGSASARRAGQNGSIPTRASRSPR